MRSGKVVKIGKSLWISIPAAWARYNDIEKGSVVEIVFNDELRVKPKTWDSSGKAKTRKTHSEIGTEAGA